MQHQQQARHHTLTACCAKLREADADSFRATAHQHTALLLLSGGTLLNKPARLRGKLCYVARIRTCCVTLWGLDLAISKLPKIPQNVFEKSALSNFLLLLYYRCKC